METIPEVTQLKKSSVKSIVSLFFQSGYSAILGLVANFAVTYYLTPKIFGIYSLTLSIISVLNYFSDIGLAGALVQKKEITHDDVKTTFTVQQIMIISVVCIAFVSTAFIQNFYHLPEGAKYLLWALLLSFFISSLKTIPSIFLERKVQFQKIVYVQILENTLFYIAVILLTVLGFGLQSFTYAVLIRAISGLIFIYTLSFWVPSVGISFKSLKQLLSFGLPFQASSFLALFKDVLINLFLGKVIGLEGVGYIEWAKKWAESPIRIIMDNISRVLFPVLARIQHDKSRISGLIEKVLKYQTMILAPVILGLALMMHSFVMLVPKYGKWAPALPLLYIFAGSAFLSSYSTPFINLLNALGKVKITFSFMAFWTLATWILVPLLTFFFGVYGFPITIFLLSLSFIIVLMQARKVIPFRFFHPIYPYIAASLSMAIITYILIAVFPVSLFTFILTILLSGATYIIILKSIFNINVITEVQHFFK